MWNWGNGWDDGKNKWFGGGGVCIGVVFCGEREWCEEDLNFVVRGGCKSD